MNIPTCPRCGKIEVAVRQNKSGRGTHLANVASYPSGRSYFRSLHTTEQCDAHAAQRAAEIQYRLDLEAAQAARRECTLRGMRYTQQFKKIFGEQAVRDNWDAIYTRWLDDSHIPLPVAP